MHLKYVHSIVSKEKIRLQNRILKEISVIIATLLFVLHVDNVCTVCELNLVQLFN